jgi:site-specific DNA-methyltransferase (adenine-specific)
MKNEQLISLPVEAVVVPPARIRRSLGNLDDLKASIDSKGQLHPIIVDKANTLISGERRLESCRELGIEVLVRYKEDLSEADMVEIEVMENAARLDFTWVEMVRATKKLHDYKVAQHGEAKGSRAGTRGWGYEMTGNLIGKHPETTRLECRVVDYMDEYPELAKLPRKTDAFKAVQKILEDAAMTELAKRSMDGSRTTGPIGEVSQDLITPEEILLMEGLSDDDKAKAIAILEAGSDVDGKSAAEVLQESSDKFVEEYGQFAHQASKWFKKGDAFKILPQLPAEEFQLVITDPPYGIDVGDSGSVSNSETGVFDDSQDWMHQNMPQYFKECYRVMAENSHMYCFFAISYYEFLLQCGRDAGFEFDPLPIIWLKGAYHGKSGDPKRYPGRCYEMILYFRKGNMPLVKPGARNTVIEDPVHGKAKIHPTEKPIGVIRDLLRRSGHPGIRILDPMAGSGAVIAAAMQWGYKPLGIELDEKYHARGLERLAVTFSKLAVSQMRALAEDKSYGKIK